MKRVVVFILLVIFFLCGCQKNDEQLSCKEYESSNEETCLVFVHRDDCKYCVKDYYYVNKYDESNPEIKIYSCKLDKDETKFNDIEIEGVPSLVLIDETGSKVVAKGYIKVRRYINSLIEN